MDRLRSLQENPKLQEVFKKTKNVGVAIIDSSHDSDIVEEDFVRSFKSVPEFHAVHDCQNVTTLSSHGWTCASILAGKEQNADFYGLKEGKIQGVVPDAKLHIYAVGCTDCVRSNELLSRAIDLAVQKGVRVISMSLGPKLKNHEPFDTKWKFTDDVVAQSTLEAFRKNILVCLSAGNDGPAFESLSYGMPWCMNVGACTNGTNLIATATIGTKRKKLPSDIKILGRAKDDKNEEIKIVDKIEGISMNILECSFRALRIRGVHKDGEGLLYEDDDEKIVYLKPTTINHRKRFNIISLAVQPMISLSRDSCKKMKDWQTEIGELYVKISKSKLSDDKRGIYVPDFSGQGPSRSFPEIIMPDLVSPGCNILAGHPSNISIGRIKKKQGKSVNDKEDLFHTQCMKTGTSVATPYVAGLCVSLLSSRPDWNIAWAKSAAITTAWSFLKNGIPGNGFMFGAGSMDLERALKPGLVYDESAENFEKHAKGDLAADKLNSATFSASFTTSHQMCERALSRELTNIENQKVSYKAEVKVYHNSLDSKAVIHVRPNFLRFTPNEKQKFELQIGLTPRPMGYISALLIWKKVFGTHSVVSPIHLYHRSSFDRRLWYPKEEAEAKKKMGKNSKGGDDNDGKDKGKAKVSDEKICGKKRSSSEVQNSK